MRERRPGTIALVFILAVLGPLPARAETPPAGRRARPSGWFSNPPPPSAFFTEPPHSSWFSNPPAASRWFTDPPRSRAAARCRVAPTTYDGLIREVAARHGVEYALVKAMIHAESDFDRLAVSPKGARGLMQLMPATASSEGVHDVFAARENVEGGCRYLRFLLDRYAGSVPLALAAYNAGPERVDAAGGIPPIAETREYLDRVLDYRLGYLLEPPGPPSPRQAPSTSGVGQEALDGERESLRRLEVGGVTGGKRL